ncbi:UBP36 hydrolase, partial [Crotophaga sulcirostris]|nr:UBP36 hydrolase [Crotophaga sulcirostris]
PRAFSMKWEQIHQIGAGLQNLGNTCFLSSTMQCLTYMPLLANYLLSKEHTRTCQQGNFCMLCTMQNHMIQAFSNSGHTIKSMHIIRDLKHIAQHIHFGHQEDAHEFLRYTIDALQRACLTSCTKLDGQAQATTLVHQIFGGSLLSLGQATHALTSPLSLQKARSITQALNIFVKPEILSGENAYTCAIRKAKPQHLSIHQASNVLMLSMKHFADFSGGKISKNVGYPEFLVIWPYMSENNGDPVMCELYAVLVHSGSSCCCGHYYRYVKASNGQWYQMNDAEVCLSNIKVVLKTQAYLLFYLR